MSRSINKSSAFLVICSALLMGVLFSSEWTLPAQVRLPTSEGDKKQALENLIKGAQPNVVAQQAQASPAPNSPQANPAASSSAFPSPSSSGPPVKYSFENLDLNDFINIVANELQLSPIIVDQDIRGTVNIVSSTPMPRSDIFPLFNLILKNNNACLIKQDNFYQIVPTSSGMKKGGVPINDPGQLPAPKPSSDQPPAAGSSASPLVTFRELARAAGAATTPSAEKPGAQHLATYVIRSEFVPVADLIDPVKLFMTDGGVIMSYPRLNMLILTDYSDSASRVMQIISMLDNNFLDPDLIELVKLNNNVPDDIIEDLKKIFGTGTNSTTGVTFTSLDRLNAILLMANSKRAIKEVKYWIDKLDASSAKTIQTHFYIVQNSTASNIAMMLAALYGAGQTNNQGRSTNATAGSGGTLGTRTGTSNNLFGNTGGTGGGGFGNTTSGGFGGGGMGGGGLGGSSSFGSSLSSTSNRGTLGPSLNVNATISSVELGGTSITGLQDTVRMVVDDINNTLVIQSTAPDYAFIYETIKKMDVMPRQVLIDAKVFQVDLNNDLKYGLTSALGTVSTAGTDSMTAASIDSAGNLLANTFSFVGNSREILLKLQALRSKTQIKVLESPSVLALDGSTASVNVGSEIPYPSGGYVTNGGSSTSINYRQTGVTLMVYPRISASGSVTMTITQEVSAQGGDVIVGDNQTATSFTVTTVSSTFAVKDGETVAIAGLIREHKDSSRFGVPFLSEIPLIGNLFGGSSRHSTRNELIVLITPHVIRTPDRMAEITQEIIDVLPNIRKFSYEHEKQRREDLEDSREDRFKREQKELKRIKPVTQAKPAESEEAEEPRTMDAPTTTEAPSKPEEQKKVEVPPQTEAPSKPEEPKKSN